MYGEEMYGNGDGMQNREKTSASTRRKDRNGMGKIDMNTTTYPTVARA